MQAELEQTYPRLGTIYSLCSVYYPNIRQRSDVLNRWNFLKTGFYEGIKLPKRQQDQAKLMLRTIPYAPTRTEAERLRTVFTRWCGDHSYEAASEALERDWDRMVTFYDFPKEHWGHLRTTNPVESPFAALRLRTDAAKRYKRVDRAIAVIWKMLMVAEQRFRRLKAPELIEDVYLGAQYADGIAIESTAEMVAA